MQITEEIKKLAVRNNKNSGILQAYKEMKKLQAEARAEARSKLTPIQQMDILNSKLGSGKGAKKERARLLRQMKETSDQKPKKSKLPPIRVIKENGKPSKKDQNSYCIVS